MPNYRVTWTTDGKHVGYEFESTDASFTMPNGFVMQVEDVIELQNGLRFTNSNYIIDAEPV